MGGWDDHLPAVAMVGLQFSGAVMALLSRASLITGMSPMVFTVYRQAIAAAITFPICYFTRGNSSRSRASMGIKSFLLIFIAAFIGVVLFQGFYYQDMTSSSIGTALSNLTPAITFVFAIILRMEQVYVTKLSSIAKIIGTVICVGGAICIAVLRGPKILNIQYPYILVFESSPSDKNWILGCFYLLVGRSCWAVWLIMQVSISKCYPDPLSLSAWMSFIGMLQAAIVAVFMDPDPQAWNLSSPLDLATCLVSRILGSGAKYFLLAWCIKKRGPFYSSVFSPLSTVITTVLACLFLHEELYVGSLLGAVAVIGGLYIVLWGKSEEKKATISYSKPGVSESQEYMNFESVLEQPLLIDYHPKKNTEVV